MPCASLLTSAGNWAAAVSRTTCRTRGSAVAEIALRLTITTSAQDGSAASARTTAAPTCPVPPMIKTRNVIFAAPLLCQPERLQRLAVALVVRLHELREAGRISLTSPHITALIRATALAFGNGGSFQFADGSGFTTFRVGRERAAG